MLIWHAVVLALFQGFTEFLPISSSAHLILLPQFSGWEDQGLSFDIAVHLGTLSAVMLYFREDIRRITIDWAASIARRECVGESRFAWGIIWGSVPLALGGVVVSLLGQDQLRSPVVIAMATIIFGILLWWADVVGSRDRDEYSLTVRDILIIGVAQAFALIPGASRSGVTMTAGLVLGLNRESAARFSFLLSIPAIIMAGGYLGLKLLTSEAAVDWAALGVGVVVSAVSAYLCIHFFLKLLERIGMLPFVIYRLLLGALLLYVFT